MTVIPPRYSSAPATGIKRGEPIFKARRRVFRGFSRDAPEVPEDLDSFGSSKVSEILGVGQLAEADTFVHLNAVLVAAFLDFA